MKRVFISIEFPENIKKEIKKIQDGLPEFRENQRFSGPSKSVATHSRRRKGEDFEVFGKKTEFNNLHLTLKFLGEINDEKIEKIIERLRRVDIKKLDCGINSLGFFSEDFIKIIWIHLAGCEEIQKKIDDSVKDLFEKEKRFMSHITIARVKSIGDKKKFIDELNKIKFKKIKFNVDKFYLMESILKPEGPEYKVLECFENKRKI